MLCGFPSRHAKDVHINKLKFSCFTSYGFLFPPSSARILIRSPQKLLSIHFTTQGTTSVINERNGFAMCQPLITQHQPGGLV